MSFRRLQRMLFPQSVAHVGASENPASISGQISHNLKTHFTGTFLPVNPTHKQILDTPCAANLGALDQAPDLAIVSVPADAVPGVLEEAASAQVPGAVVITDLKRGALPAAEGRRAIRALCRRTGLRVIGPNCLGIAAPRLGLHATMSRLLPETGPIAFVGQSATAAGPLVDWAASQGLGFSHLVSLGDMADVDYGDILYLLAEDSRTRAIVLYLERVPGARHLLSAARVAARVKPVIVLKSGTAGLAEPDEPGRDGVYDGVFARAGLIRVRTLEDLFDALEAVGTRLPADAHPGTGEKLAILANGESMGALALDTLIERGGRLALLAEETIEAIGVALPPGARRTNPIDILPDADGPRYCAAMEALLADPGIDAILALSGPTGIVPSSDHARGVVDAVAAARKVPGRRRPFVMTSWPGGREADAARALFAEAHIATFPTPSKAVTTFTYLVETEHRRARLMETPASVPEALDVDAARVAGILDAHPAPAPQTLPGTAAREILSAYGMAPRPANRAEAGGLRLEARLDREFGPILILGAGGRIGARLDAGAVGVPPLTETLARDLIAESRAARALELEEALSRRLIVLVMQAGQLFADHPRLVRIFLDEIHVFADSYSARGIVLEAADPEAPGLPAREPAFRPYPSELESRVRDRQGREYLLRPICPEDEPALITFYEKVEEEDRRLRFLHPLRTLSHEFAARLTQIDYDRQMAFVLTGEGLAGKAEIFAVVRLALEPGDESAEYAITVRSDLKGRGLGRLLMERLIAHGRQIGLASIYGLVLRENRAMRELARKLGFTQSGEPGEPGITRVTLDLTATPA